MKKTYIIPQVCMHDIVAHAILAGSEELRNIGYGEKGAHGESKIADTDFDFDFDDEDE